MHCGAHMITPINKYEKTQYKGAKLEACFQLVTDPHGRWNPALNERKTIVFSQEICLFGWKLHSSPEESKPGFIDSA